MSIRKRAGTSDEITQKNEKDSLEKRKEQLQLKRLQNEESWKQRKQYLMWLIIILVLIALTYYYYTYQPSKKNMSSQQRPVQTKNSKKQDTNDPAAASSSKREQTKENEKKKDSKLKSKSSSQKKSNTQTKKPNPSPKSPPTGSGKPPPTGSSKPPPTGSSKPPPTGSGKPPPTGSSKPPPTGSSKPPPTGSSKPPPTGSGKPPPTGSSKPPPTGSGKPPPTGSGKPPPTGSSKPPKDDSLLKKKITDLPILRRPIPPADSDRPLIMEILAADDLLADKQYQKAVDKFDAILNRFKQSPRGLLGKALSLEGLGKRKKSPKLVDKAIDLYYQVGFDSFLANDDIKMAALVQLVSCSKSRNKENMAIKALEKIVEMEPEYEAYVMKLSQAYISSGKLAEAKQLLNKLVTKDPNNVLVAASLGYIFYKENNCTGALPWLLYGISEGTNVVPESGKLYLYAGECLTKLRRPEEAETLYNEAVARGLFPSAEQRSLHNEPSIKTKPWWPIMETNETQLLAFEEKLNVIKNEILPHLDNKTYLFPHKKDVFVLYSKGIKKSKECGTVPETCKLLNEFPAATKCKRGETRFLSFPRSFHIPPHYSSTNTKLRALLPIKLYGTLRVRVNKETKVLREGKMVIFDDSYEQELWYTGTKRAIVLVIEFWHPNLPEAKRKRLKSL